MEDERAEPTRVSGSPPHDIDQMAAAKEEATKPLGGSGAFSQEATDYLNAGSASAYGNSAPGTPGLTQTISNSDSSNFDSFGNDNFPPLDRLTMFDILENLSLPQRLEKMQSTLSQQAEKVRNQRRKIASRAQSGKDNIVQEWRKRVPVGPEEQLDKYRKRMRTTVDKLNTRFNDAKTVTLGEKVSFVTAVLNIFISGWLIGAWPEIFHYWYTAQLAYFMPIRWYKYHKIGYHYFLADLCYFVNLLLILSIWFFPQSKRLFISTYCLAFGNNAVAIVMWRNSLVFHSVDKVTSLFIHIMPCATLHCIVHLLSREMLEATFPAVAVIKYSEPGTPEHYSLWAMILWVTLPYAVWQLSYHFLITVRKRSKIAAGNPTSFTFLKKSYKNNPLGKFVLSCPDSLQEPVFMVIQYSYALLTMVPCPLWFWYRWASSVFMMVILAWSSWNGATFYIDVFGRRMEKELNALKKEVQNMTKSPSIEGMSNIGSPVGSPAGPEGKDAQGAATTSALDLGPPANEEVHSRGNEASDGPVVDGSAPNVGQEQGGEDAKSK